jgi:two-component system nitrogen regulation response regulator GlnG
MSTTTSEPGAILEFEQEFERFASPFASDTRPRRLAAGSALCDVAAQDFVSFLDRELGSGTTCLYADAVAWMERRLLVRVLRETNGNKSKACQILGITRGSLRHKISQLGISIHQTVSVCKSCDPLHLA